MKGKEEKKDLKGSHGGECGESVGMEEVRKESAESVA